MKKTRYYREFNIIQKGVSPFVLDSLSQFALNAYGLKILYKEPNKDFDFLGRVYISVSNIRKERPKNFTYKNLEWVCKSLARLTYDLRRAERWTVS